MSTTEPSKWSTALGASADVNTLPQTTPTGTGLASLSGLFPQITQIPLDSGGIAPERADFNALFKLLGDYIYYIMQGGVFSYSTSYAYSVGDLVRYSGILYRCIQAHSAGTAAPGNAAYWTALAYVGDIPTKTSQLQNDSGFVTSASVPTKTSQLQNDSGFITSSSLPTVNNGTLTIQQDGTTVGTFTANQSGNTTVNITGGGAGSGAFGIGSTVMVGVASNVTLGYGTTFPGGTYAEYCPDDQGGYASGSITIPGTWVSCVGNGNTSNPRGALIRRIA